MGTSRTADRRTLRAGAPIPTRALCDQRIVRALILDVRSTLTVDVGSASILVQGASEFLLLLLALYSHTLLYLSSFCTCMCTGVI